MNVWKCTLSFFFFSNMFYFSWGQNERITLEWLDVFVSFQNCVTKEQECVRIWSNCFFLQNKKGGGGKGGANLLRSKNKTHASLQ